MKKIVLLLALTVSFITASAQSAGSQIYVTTPSTSLQSYGTFYVQGYDSVAVSSAAGNVTLPSGYLNLQVDINLNYSAGKYTGTITLPASPVTGQKVEINSKKSFLYHTWSTSPAYILKDSVGSQSSTLIYDGAAGYWKMVK